MAKLRDKMKELLLQYARYNVWANKRIIDILSKMDVEVIMEKEFESSFPTLKDTVYHIWSAEFIWLQRLQLTENPVWISDIFKGSFEEACTVWQDVSLIIVQFIEKQYDDRAFEHVFQFYDHVKESYKFPVYTALTHVLNHSSQHRGQIITMLRQAGIAKIPSIDLCTFVTS